MRVANWAAQAYKLRPEVRVVNYLNDIEVLRFDLISSSNFTRHYRGEEPTNREAPRDR
jgi:hypothetical protein